MQVIPAPGSELKQREADRHTHKHTQREGGMGIRVNRSGQPMPK